MTRIDTDLALMILATALESCGKIRRDRKWTQSGAESARLHAFILSDIERNTIPRCDGRTAMILRGAVNGERAALAS
jgi:hypothetical protein